MNKKIVYVFDGEEMKRTIQALLASATSIEHSNVTLAHKLMKEYVETLGKY